jgi:hypothetical protein
MIIINFDLTAGTAKLAQTTTIKVGAAVPVQVAFSASPDVVNSIKLALGDDSDAPSVLAYVDSFTAENDTTYTAVLDASDTRLAAFMTGKGPTAVDVELDVTLDGIAQVAPNLSITVQPRIITGPTTSDGGPLYYTEPETDAAIAAAIAPLTPAANLADINISNAVSTSLFAGSGFAALAIKIIAAAGAGPYTAAYGMPVSSQVRGAIAEVNIELAASANPTIELHSATTGGTLLATVTNPTPTAPSYWYGRFRFDGTAWHCLFRAFQL